MSAFGVAIFNGDGIDQPDVIGESPALGEVERVEGAVNHVGVKVAVGEVGAEGVMVQQAFGFFIKQSVKAIDLERIAGEDGGGRLGVAVGDADGSLGVADAQELKRELLDCGGGKGLGADTPGADSYGQKKSGG